MIHPSTGIIQHKIIAAHEIVVGNLIYTLLDEIGIFGFIWHTEITIVTVSTGVGNAKCHFRTKANIGHIAIVDRTAVSFFIYSSLKTITEYAYCIVFRITINACTITNAYDSTMVDGRIFVDKTGNAAKSTTARKCLNLATVDVDVMDRAIGTFDRVNDKCPGTTTHYIYVRIVKLKVAHFAIIVQQLADEGGIDRLTFSARQIEVGNGTSHTVEHTSEILDEIGRIIRIVKAAGIFDVTGKTNHFLLHIRVCTLLYEQHKLTGIGDVGPTVNNLGITLGNVAVRQFFGLCDSKRQEE